MAKLRRGVIAARFETLFAAPTRDGEQLQEASLGKLLKFDGQGRTVAAGRDLPHGGATILIFTGVRYERGLPPPTDTSFDSKRRKRKRV